MKELEQNNDAYASRSCFYEALLSYQFGDDEESIELASQCITNLKDRPYCTEVGRSYNLIGTVYINKGDFLHAIDYYLKALEIVVSNNDEEIAGYLYNNLGNIYNRLNDYETSIVYFKKAVKILTKEKKNSELYMIALTNLALVHCDVGEFEIAKQIYEEIKQCEKIVNVNANKILGSIIKIRIAYDCNGFKIIFEEMDKLIMAIEEDGIELNIDDLNELVKMIVKIMNIRLKEKLCRLLALLSQKVKSVPMTDLKLLVLKCEIEYNKMIGDQEQINKLLLQFYDTTLKKERENEKAFVESANVKLQMQALIQLQQETEQNSRKYKEKSERDDLTGLHNRSMLKTSVEPLFFRAKEQQLLVGVIIFDINYFKQYNDYYGHVEGDRCIRELTSIMLRLCDDRIHFIRYGGDEFLAFFNDMDEYEIKSIAHLIQSEIRALNIENKNSLDDEKIVSIAQGGYLGIPTGKDNLYDFISKADDALYEGKRNKNYIVIHQQEDIN
ncbi:MAG: diguanylate cyclase [Bacilli bacterium]|nr:diguanylate cyclase [Bacilli bacterium]